MDAPELRKEIGKRPVEELLERVLEELVGMSAGRADYAKTSDRKN